MSVTGASSSLSAELVGRVLSIVGQLRGCGIAYAVGGAIAYDYAGVPRATADIDINIFLPEDQAERVFDCLAPLGVTRPDAEGLARLQREGQVRLDWEGVFVDLFFAYHPFYESCAARARAVPFDGDTIEILSPEDIAVFKVIFNRPQDWADIGQIVAVQGERFDRAYIRHWLAELLGAEDSQVARFEGLLRESGGEG